MKILYVSDLDGTLLSTRTELSDYCAETLNKLIGNGLLFTYATARSYSSASIITKKIQCKLPVVVYNGAFLYHPKSRKYLTVSGFTDVEREQIEKKILKHHVAPFVYSCIGNREYVTWIPEHENDGMRFYLSNRKDDRRLNPVQEIDALFAKTAFYYTCIGTYDKLYPLYKELEKNGSCNCIFQKEIYRDEYWCEIMPRAATKANAVLALKKYLRADRIVVFGDAINDISMFEVSDACYAVENAVGELKEICTEVIGSNDKDGVVKWLLAHADEGKIITM